MTDLVILRKRLPGEKQRSDLWTQTEEVPNPAGREPIQLNSYLALHRSQILGEFNGNNRMHPGDAYVDLTEDFDQRLEDAIRRLPENVMSDRAAALQAEMKEAGKAMKRGGYVVEDGELFRNVDGQLIKVEADARRIQRIEGMLKIRDVLNALTDAEMGRTQDSADTLRKELNTAYDRFAARYGAISDKANRDALEGDPELPLCFLRSRLRQVGEVRLSWQRARAPEDRLESGGSITVAAGGGHGIQNRVRASDD